MSTADQRVLELAIQALEIEQTRIQQELNDLKGRLSGRATKLNGMHRGRPAAIAAPATRPASPNKGRTMSAAQKRKIGRAMKARWAQRRAAAGK